jgi:hypothetical protein
MEISPAMVMTRAMTMASRGLSTKTAEIIRKKGLLFLKKKKQKDFYSCASGKIRTSAAIVGVAEK